MVLNRASSIATIVDLLQEVVLLVAHDEIAISSFFLA